MNWAFFELISNFENGQNFSFAKYFVGQKCWNFSYVTKILSVIVLPDKYFLYFYAVLALFEKVLILLLLAVDSGPTKMSDASLASLVCILSVSGPFLEYRDFRMVLISVSVILEPQPEEAVEMELDCKFPFLWISAILGWFLYSTKIEVKSPFLLLDPISNSTFSGLKPQDRSTMIM